MATRQKAPREIRQLTFTLTARIAEGAEISTVQGFASRQVLLTTTTAASVSVEDSTIRLTANPKAGARVILDPGSASGEETFKVTSVTPDSGNFLCGIHPTAEQPHSSGATVNYQPGVSISFLLDEMPVPDDETTVTFLLAEGADGQTYTVEVEAVCDNGEIVEDETEVEAIEFEPTSTIEKQPGETMDFAIDFADWISDFSTTLLSAVAYIAREFGLNTTLAAGASAGASTIALTANPGLGALLTINPNSTPPTGTREQVWVSQITGTGPYTATISPLQFDHSTGETVNYYTGANPRILVSSTATIDGTEARWRGKKGQAGQTYHGMALATLADGQLAQKSFRLTTPEH